VLVRPTDPVFLITIELNPDVAFGFDGPANEGAGDGPAWSVLNIATFVGGGTHSPPRFVVVGIVICNAGINNGESRVCVGHSFHQT